MIRRIAVVVPAADEEDSIAACLSALVAAVEVVRVPVRVVVVLDSCTDGTAGVVARFPSVETVETSARNVGHARRLGAAFALLDDEDPDELWLASTDADSQVPKDWLTRMVALAASTDLVLGTVLPDTGLRPAVARAWFARHQLGDGHPHVHAANLGVRGSAYVALGGWRALATGEDADLAARAVAAGLRVRRSASLPVRTSTRAFGRAPSGFSSYLRALGHT